MSAIALRGPDGEVEWVLIELQGTIETRNGVPLDGVEFGTLVREVCLKHCTRTIPLTCLLVLSLSLSLCCLLYTSPSPRDS